jgi:hypothetical protein
MRELAGTSDIAVRLMPIAAPGCRRVTYKKVLWMSEQLDRAERGCAFPT